MKIKEDAVSYQSDTSTYNGFVAYDENKEGKRPVVLIVHEWWGISDYVRGRAKQLAQMGYLAMAVDMYGNGKTAVNPGDAQKFRMVVIIPVLFAPYQWQEVRAAVTASII